MQIRSTKRQKEQARAQKHKEKNEQRAERKRVKADKPELAEGAEDPDIAGIIPGPQPLPDGF